MTKKIVSIIGMLCSLLFLACSIYLNIYLGFVMDEFNLSSETDTANVFSWVLLFVSIVTVILFILGIVIKSAYYWLTGLGIFCLIALVGLTIGTNHLIEKEKDLGKRKVEILQKNPLEKVNMDTMQKSLATKKKELFM